MTEDDFRKEMLDIIEKCPVLLLPLSFDLLRLGFRCVLKCCEPSPENESEGD